AGARREKLAGRRTYAHRAVEIDIDDLAEGLGIVLGRAANDARAVDDNVEAREPGDARADGGLVAYVDGERLPGTKCEPMASTFRFRFAGAGDGDAGTENAPCVGNRRSNAA